jgi:mRNA-degrading endonuclease YafQ of YafQ-DinJ toxin-antitoxin module
MNDIRKLINAINSIDHESNLLEYILKEYNINDLFTFDTTYLGEDLNNLKPYETENWDIDYSNAFKKGVKKYRNNPKVLKELKELERWITSHSEKPEKSTFPPQYNVHIIKTDPKFSGAYDAHIIGSKIITLFFIETDSEKLKLRWIYLGTHEGANSHLA